jgi:hypothetical protein
MARHSRLFFDLALVASALITSACTTPESRSAIVDRVEQAGSGSLSSTSTDSIQQWFVKHRDLSHEVDAMCNGVRQNATAQWTESTEGRVCAAARNIEVMRAVPAQGDGRTFQPGLH